MDDDNQIQCRICLEPAERNEVIAPCRCTGTSKWVHRVCLDKWRSAREDRAFSKCTECLQDYVFVSPEKKTDKSCSRKTHFILLVTRDILIMVTTIIGIVALFGSLVYVCDKSKSELIQYFQMKGYPGVFYGICGLLVFFAIIGLLGSCVSIFGDSCNNNPACTYYGDTCFYWDNLFYINTPGNSHCCTCCTTNSTECCGGTCTTCHSCDCHGCTMLECGTCTNCEGGIAAGAEEGCAICVLGLVVILAIFGIIICVVIGIQIMNKVISRHIHVLNKWTMTQEFIVADLDSSTYDEITETYKVSNSINTIEKSMSPVLYTATSSSSSSSMRHRVYNPLNTNDIDYTNNNTYEQSEYQNIRSSGNNNITSSNNNSNNNSGTPVVSTATMNRIGSNVHIV